MSRSSRPPASRPIALGGDDKWPGAFWWEYLAVRVGGQAAFNAAVSRNGSFTDQPFVAGRREAQELVALQPFQNGFLGAACGDEPGPDGQRQGGHGADGPVGAGRLQR